MDHLLLKFRFCSKICDTTRVRSPTRYDAWRLYANGVRQNENPPERKVNARWVSWRTYIHTYLSASCAPAVKFVPSCKFRRYKCRIMCWESDSPVPPDYLPRGATRPQRYRPLETSITWAKLNILRIILYIFLEFHTDFHTVNVSYKYKIRKISAKQKRWKMRNNLFVIFYI